MAGKSWYHIYNYADHAPARGVFIIKKEDYRFSVVVPIYNVEEYLEETVDSVLAQTIGFEKCVQLILVNDGSPDNCQAFTQPMMVSHCGHHDILLSIPSGDFS